MCSSIRRSIIRGQLGYRLLDGSRRLRLRPRLALLVEVVVNLARVAANQLGTLTNLHLRGGDRLGKRSAALRNDLNGTLLNRADWAVFRTGGNRASVQDSNKNVRPLDPSTRQ